MAPIIFLERGSNLLGGIREGVAQSAVDHIDAQIDGRAGGWRLLTGLESDVIEQGGLGERVQCDGAGVMEAFPPAEEVKQDIGRRPVRQDGEGQSTGPAHAAADPNPVVAFVMGLFPPPAVARDRILAAPRAASWQKRQRKCRHPGSDLSSGSGSAIKRITAGVKARR